MPAFHSATQLATEVSGGFPPPTKDSTVIPLDLNRYLIAHPSATYFLRFQGDSLRASGIMDNDILIVDRSLPLQNSAFIIAEFNGNLLARYFQKEQGHTLLSTGATDATPLLVTKEDEFVLWGTVIGSFRKY